MGYVLEGAVFNRCLPRSVKDDLRQMSPDELVVLQARAKSEDQVIARLSKEIHGSQKTAKIWELRVDEQSEEIHSMNGILRFSSLFAEPSSI
jgi:ribosomal protein L29